MSLFGNPQSSQPQQTSSLFGSTTQNKPSLFSGLSQPQGQQQNQQQQSGTTSLFGQPQNQQQQNGTSSLFGASTNQPAQTTSLFGQPQNQSNTQQQQTQQAGGSLFGGLNTNTQQNANQFGSSLLQSTTQQPQNNLMQSRLGTSIAEATQRREKSIPEQMESILKKWSPESRECLTQQYFYNEVPPGTAIYWGPGPEDEEHKWEEALQKKPSDNAVPLLVRGFQQLGTRLATQVQAVQQLQLRLHEMNNSLDAMMQNHELVLSIRAAEAKRKHIGLSQRCLALAIKVQVLRSRGFVLDSAEEELRKKLAGLEKGVFDPGFGGREEEIWARMVALRERTRWLQSESEKLGKQVSSGEKAGISEDVLRKTKKILNDYDAQIMHLKKELENVGSEFKDWEASNRPAGI